MSVHISLITGKKTYPHYPDVSEWEISKNVSMQGYIEIGKIPMTIPKTIRNFQIVL